MQYLHIVFHMAVTSPEASDMPEKNAHGTERKFEQFQKKKEIALTTPYKSHEKYSLCSLQSRPQITPHILHFPYKTHREMHSFAAKVTSSLRFVKFSQP